MRIAVPYEAGQINQHFGHSEQFKIYEIMDNKVVGSEVVNTEGEGHGAIAAFLVQNVIDVVICGGMGAGAQMALEGARIDVFTGVSGDADAAVEAFLRDEIESEGVNCDCGGDDEEGGCGNCGGGCGGCGGGCGGCGGSFEPPFEGENVGKVLAVHYLGTFNDGEKFDSSYDRGEPIEFVCGAGQMIPGFDKACKDLKVGEIINIHLMPEEAYGMSNPNAVMEFKIAQLPGCEDFQVGDKAMLQDMYGRPVPVTVTAKTEETITLDANHEMAGKELNFKIELVEVK